MVASLVSRLGRDGAKRYLKVARMQFDSVAAAAMAYHWPAWGRPKQVAPLGKWRSWGFLCGRGYGKTRSLAEFITREVYDGHAPRVALCAQNEDKTIEIQIEGNSGLIKVAPPWFRPKYEPSKRLLRWPNGATAHIFTPEVPGAIRGPEFHLSWLSELQSWPASTMMESHDNFMLSTRLGYSRIVWDATPKRRHKILKERLAMAEAEPGKHRVTRGSIYENATNLGEGVVEDLERKMGGTQRGKEELLGEMLDDDENAIVKQAWIDAVRRPKPEKFARKVIAIDPAITERAGSDESGIILAGLGLDEQAYVLANRTGKYGPAEWAKVVLDLYSNEGASLVLVETNKGGDLVTRNLRAAAHDRGLQVITIGKDERAPMRRDAVVFVREIHTRGTKEDRAQPVAIAYERGRVSHVRGVDLATLEDTLTTWVPEPGARSPDDLDALVLAVSELLELGVGRQDNSKDVVGVGALARELRSPRKESALAAALRNSGGGRGV